MQSVQYPDVSAAVEEWRPIEGYEGFYEASTHGRIRALPRIVPVAGRARQRCLQGRVMQSTQVNPFGHQCVGLHKDGVRKTCLVHRLVLETWVGPCPEGMEACHNDGNPRNNAVTNLRWDSSRANKADKLKHGTLGHGERIYGAKLRDADIPRIRALLADGVSRKAIAAEYGVPAQVIGYIARGQTWRHVP